MKIYSLVILFVAQTLAQGGSQGGWSPPSEVSCASACVSEYSRLSCPSDEGTGEYCCLQADDCFCLGFKKDQFFCCLESACNSTDYTESGGYWEWLCTQSPPILNITVNATVPTNLTCTATATSSTISLASNTSPTPVTTTSHAAINSASTSNPTEATAKATQTPLPTSKPSLSTGDKAGIAIGALGAIIITLLFLFRRHRNSKPPEKFEDPLPFEIELPTKDNAHEMEA